jgi:hypothetical protein
MSYHFNHFNNFNNFNFNYERGQGRARDRGHYDQYGNFIPNERPQSIFAQYILQTVSDTVRSALNNLSNQIENHLMGNAEDGDDVTFYNPRLHPQSQPQRQPQYVVIRYKNMPNKKDHTSCPICFDDYDDSSMVLSTECLHFFHEGCLKKWADVNKTCPICRTEL